MSQSVQFLPKSSTTPHASEPQPLLLAAQREEQILLKNKYPKHLCCRRCRHLSIEQPCSSINSYKLQHQQHASPVVDVKESAGDWTKKEPLRPNEKVQ
ncbi:hypothetical protein T4C_1395 [Trichinella pseudospiralis]|uniref:Uncharacterized protein n=1 Tax=Trichinella pseudospiralis TaxID=6337 RepID=A0A0V1KE99_TRIPS|nr:hypothetical protein T4C_1395 [Trichinella pseudospiralis]